MGPENDAAVRVPEVDWAYASLHLRLERSTQGPIPALELGLQHLVPPLSSEPSLVDGVLVQEGLPGLLRLLHGLVCHTG